jgi:hypothetical protein
MSLVWYTNVAGLTVDGCGVGFSTVKLIVRER